MADLITVDEFLAATGQTTDDLDSVTGIPQIQAGITAASAQIRGYTDHKFELASELTNPVSRDYLYTGGLLEIDDAQSISTVAIKDNQFTVGRTLDSTEWWADSLENPVGMIDHLDFFTILPFIPYSPAMGFNRNLDNYPVRRGPVIITVTGTFGYDTFPPELKAAAIITTNFSVVESDPSAISSEAIAGYSRSFSNQISGGFARSNPGMIPAIYQQIPLRALPLLDPYLRWNC